jgi:hypothetical protein
MGKGRRVGKGGVGAVLLGPVRGCPRVAIEITDADVVGGDPVWSREWVVRKDLIDGFPHRHVRIEIADRVELRERLVQLKYPELGPRIGEPLGDEEKFEVLTGKENVGAVEEEVGTRGFELESPDSIGREGGGVEDDEGVFGAALPEGMGEDNDTREVRGAGD